MTPVLLEVRGLSRRFGAIAATDHVDLDVREGEIHALIGPNGAGKSTLLSQLAGEIQSDTGTIRLAGREITRLPPAERARLGIARSFQITSLFEQASILENVLLAATPAHDRGFHPLRPADRPGAVRTAALDALDLIGLGHRLEEKAAALAHGDKRQLELAMALAGRPRLLLLDEPLAGQAGAESRATVALLERLRHRHTVLLVEHDMDAVFQLADRITVMVEGRRIASGPPAVIRADAAVRAAYLGDA